MKGIRLDFVAYPHDITDQLAAFSSITTDLDKEYPGTIVRIPFRNPDQANSSEISSLTVTPADILQYFEEFQTDVAESLTFLKSIERIEFYFNGRKLGTTHILNTQLIRTMRASIARAISTNSSVSCGAAIEIFREYNASQSTQTIHVQQKVFPTETIEPELREWALEEKLVCWIALDDASGF